MIAAVVKLILKILLELRGKCLSSTSWVHIVTTAVTLFIVISSGLMEWRCMARELQRQQHGLKGVLGRVFCTAWRTGKVRLRGLPQAWTSTCHRLYQEIRCQDPYMLHTFYSSGTIVNCLSSGLQNSRVALPVHVLTFQMSRTTFDEVL